MGTLYELELDPKAMRERLKTMLPTSKKEALRVYEKFDSRLGKFIRIPVKRVRIHVEVDVEVLS